VSASTFVNAEDGLPPFDHTQHKAGEKLQNFNSIATHTSIMLNYDYFNKNSSKVYI